MFLLAAIGVMSSMIYFMFARIERWQNQVEVLKENSDAERKFLVNKLRDLHHRLEVPLHSAAIVTYLRSCSNELTSGST